MSKEYKKINDKTIEVATVIPEEIIPENVEKSQYDIDFLVAQKERIYQDYDNTVLIHAEELAKRQAEKDEIDILLSEAEKLGITTVVSTPESEVING